VNYYNRFVNFTANIVVFATNAVIFANPTQQEITRGTTVAFEKTAIGTEPQLTLTRVVTPLNQTRHQSHSNIPSASTNVVLLTQTPLLAEPLHQLVFKRGKQLPSNPNNLWRIAQGIVRTLAWDEEGTTITLGYWGPGDVVGQSLSQVQPYEIHCLTTVELSLLPPELWSQLADALIQQMKQTEQFLSIVHQNPTSLRLWQFLVWLGNRFGRDVAQGQLIDLPLTHQDIAEAISTTRVTVTRMVQQLKSEGKLLQHRRQLIICKN